ncbi:phosphoenolpyruvate--protein phosphotransferase [Rubritalea profundi]|uniref:Phosphoenolpyruvate-protein phosphotransferase n=1 Tax=Rubritalea profundi TaxID=1658618 RepID=A0A2S7TZB6_9BACT|nr:phosphoenolpyruvate--protein phosphotransferase [Rubritalea profundi]PQJ27474.1 phosphoenolpyruvate--protein phosphotransferase [Rubritalea profundi]
MPVIPSNKEVVIQGTAVSPGLAFAPAHVISRGLQAPDVYEITLKNVEKEIQRVHEALNNTKLEISKLQKHIEEITQDTEGQIFEAHLMLLSDRTMIKRVEETIRDRQQNAEFSFYAVLQNYSEAMRRVNDPYLAERAADIDDITQRVIRNFSADEASLPSDECPEHNHIIIAHDLSPSDTASMDRNRSIGFATEQGSINSHTAILARSLGIPAVVDLQGLIIEIQELSHTILDGYDGKLIINPKPSTIAYYQDIKRDKEARERQLDNLKDRQTETTDGREIILSANVEFKHEFPLVEASGAAGIGLFRTEFYLLGKGEIPSEDNQYHVYAEAASITQPHQAIIRTLDAGGDKLPAEPLPEPEPNPFLGWRGIRVSLTRIGMFKEQLRAILRASAHGRLGVMFPLVSGISELMKAKSILQECMDELDSEGTPYDPGIEVGMMIEVPSAAIMANEFAKEVDFFSIGTNDLIQYTVAVDRINKHVSKLYKPTNPAVIRLIKMTIEAANKHGIWTGVCGEMASDLELTPLLIGLGVDELSVGTHQLPRIKKAIRSLSHAECATIADEALRCRFSSDILALTKGLAQRSYGGILE